MAILPQDRGPPVERALKIPARLHDDIQAYAEAHSDGDGKASDVDYMILEILRDHLEQPKSHRASADFNGKRPKENGKKGK